MECSKMKLVSNWKYLHKTYTVLLSLLGLLIGVIDVIIPMMTNIQPFFEPSTYGIIMIVLHITITVARYIQQESLETSIEETPKELEDV